ncbi:MAG: heavy metal translocating P-type ATPase [Deltaproteobacteria bacterium]|nr:heavy metal translocating P-type ATPase [Deltaproteobacteria bacterium]
MSDNNKICYHCGQEIPSGNGIKSSINNKDLVFCCNGCKAVCSYIYDAGMGAYYEKRDVMPIAPPDDIEIKDFNASFADDRVVKGHGDIKEASLIVDGIHCAACVWLIEKALKKANGILDARVNMTTNRLSVKWDKNIVSLGDIAKKIFSIGYKAHPYNPQMLEASIKNKNNDLLFRMAFAGFGAGNIMMIAAALYAGYFSGIEEGYKNLFHWTCLFLATPVVFYSGFPFIKGAYRGVANRAVNMDLPITIGILVTYIYSFVVTIAGIGEVYFDSVTMFIFFILIGRYLESTSRQRAFSATERLINLSARNAVVIRDNKKISVPIQDVKVNDLIEIKPGDKIPVDGVVIDGGANVDESMLTGESMPVKKSAGSSVTGATINMDGNIVFRATRVGDDTVLSQIIRLIEDAGSAKTRIQKLADNIAGYFIFVILLTALGAYLYWQPYSQIQAILTAVTILIITCPCALALATPAAVIIGTGYAAKNGMLFKNGDVMEIAAKALQLASNGAAHIVLDKTGVITQGKMGIDRAVSFSDKFSPDAIIQLAASVERFSEHPIAKAINEEAKKKKISAVHAYDFIANAGQGVFAKTDIGGIRIGRLSFVSEKVDAGHKMQDTKTTVYCSLNNSVIGAIVLSDIIRKEAKAAIKDLKDMGLNITLLTGDSQSAAMDAAKQVGIDNVIANCLPHEKDDFIKELKKNGETVIMVGDGINDAIAMTRADVGIAIGSASDVSIEAADIIFINNSLNSIPEILRLSKKTFSAMKQNLFLSFLYNAVVIPLAFMGYIIPMVGAVAMPLSSLIVIGNSMRIAKYREEKIYGNNIPYDSSVNNPWVVCRNMLPVGIKNRAV